MTGTDPSFSLGIAHGFGIAQGLAFFGVALFVWGCIMLADGCR